MLKIKLYFAILFLFILLITFSFIVTGCSNTTYLEERTSPPQIDSAYVYDMNHDGIIDELHLTFNRNMDDASFTEIKHGKSNLTKWLFKGSNILTFATGFDTDGNANDKKVILYYNPSPRPTDDLTIDTSTTGASLSFLGDDTVKDLTGIEYSQYLPKNYKISEFDRAEPVIKIAQYRDVSADVPGASPNDTIDIIFSEEIADLSGDISSKLDLNNLGFGTSPKYEFLGDRVRVTLKTGPFTLDVNGSSSINLDDAETSIVLKDRAGNIAVARNTFADVVNADDPTVIKAILRDTDFDEKIDAVDLQFSEPVRDSTINPSKWMFSRNSNSIPGNGYDTLGTSNDIFVRITTPDTTTDINTTVSAAAVSFLEGNTIEDLYYNKLAAMPKVPVSDGMGPVIRTAVASDNAGGDRVTITFGESTNKMAISVTNINSLLALNNGHSWGNFASAVWSSDGKTLTITFAISGTQTIASGDTITPGVYNDGSNDYKISDGAGNISPKSVTLTGTF